MSIIEVKGLCKSFGALEVLRDVDLTVEEGEKIAIIGGSGCGKSVFLRSLELLEKPNAGSITICVLIKAVVLVRTKIFIRFS